MNAVWHQKNPLSRNATMAQSAAWHVEHWEKCGCRPIPRSVLRVLDLRARVLEQQKTPPNRYAGDAAAP